MVYNTTCKADVHTPAFCVWLAELLNLLNLFPFRVRLCQQLGQWQRQWGERLGVRERRERGRLWVWGGGRGWRWKGQEKEKERIKEAGARKRKVANASIVVSQTKREHLWICFKQFLSLKTKFLIMHFVKRFIKLCNPFHKSIILWSVLYTAGKTFCDSNLQILLSIPVSRAVKKKRGSTRGRVNTVRVTQSLNLMMRRRASLKAANQSLKSLTQKQRSKRKRRY